MLRFHSQNLRRFKDIIREARKNAKNLTCTKKPGKLYPDAQCTPHETGSIKAPVSMPGREGGAGPQKREIKERLYKEVSPRVLVIGQDGEP